MIMKLLLLLLGLGSGAAGTASWLLSLPETPSEPLVPASPDSVQARVNSVRTRVAQAVAEGRRAGADTEQRLKTELDSYRKGAAS
jgi:hypothetical protein